MKICANCKWSTGNNVEFLRCNHPSNFKIDLTTGKKTRCYEFCSTKRMYMPLIGWIFDIITNDCGWRGRHYESKEQ